MAKGEVVIKCPVCERPSPNEVALRRHVIRVHPTDGPVGCRFCPRRFLDQRAADTHMGRRHPERFTRSRNNPRVMRSWNLRANYGISIDDYDRMLAGQGGCCAVCGVPGGEARPHRLHVDHDHITGLVRGLLCANCNHALGKLRDDPNLIRALAAYIEERM